MLWGEILALLVVASITILAFIVIGNVLRLALNCVIGFFALFGFNYLFNASIAINFWSVIFIAVGGIIGFSVVVGCHYLAWAF
jgi:hypothetical protein